MMKIECPKLKYKLGHTKENYKLGRPKLKIQIKLH